MMREVFTRRFARALKEDPDRSKGQWPDLVIIDGGAGQLAQAQLVLADLGISELRIVSIAKGPDRNAGRERFFMPGKPPFSLEPRDPLLYFLQRLRDEAHRFAIGTPSRPALPRHHQLAAGRGGRHRRRPQTRAAAAFRLGQGGRQRQTGRSGSRAGNFQRRGA